LTNIPISYPVKLPEYPLLKTTNGSLIYVLIELIVVGVPDTLKLPNTVILDAKVRLAAKRLLVKVLLTSFVPVIVASVI
jgi:hypothetical protein